MATGLENYVHLLRKLGRNDETTQMKARAKAIRAMNTEAN